MNNTKSPVVHDIMKNYVLECRLKMGESVREIRKKKGYSQDELAEIMNISRTTISKIENGKFNCSLDYLSKFSWFLGFDVVTYEHKNIK